MVMLCDHNGVAFECEITFVQCSEEGIEIGFCFDRMAECNFVIIAVTNLVRKYKSTKAEEGMEGC